MSTATPKPAQPATARALRGVYQITAITTLGFAAFYTFYSSASVTLADARPDGGIRVAITMAIVVGTQLLLLIADRLVANRRAAVGVAVTLIAIGSALLPFFNHWAGQILLGLGFGLMVVAGVAWVKEIAPSGHLGKALGIYGFGASVGGAIGAPLGLLVAEPFGLAGVAVTGALLGIASLVTWIFTQIPQSTGLESGTDDQGGQGDHDQPANVVSASKSSGTATTTQANTGSYVLTSLSLFAGHLIAVTLYAMVLSSLGTTAVAATAALFIQAALAIGRLIGGRASDRYAPVAVLLIAGVALILCVAGFALTENLLLLVITAGLVGLASGIAQSGALTGLMAVASTPRQINRGSVAFNIGFDAGLGLGAFLLTLLGRS